MSVIAQHQPELPAGRTDPDDKRLTIYVIATTTDGTRAALEATDRLTAGLNPCIVLLVPCVVPYGEALQRSLPDVLGAAERFRPLVDSYAGEVQIHVAVCRPDDAHLDRMLPRGATVIVGGRVGRFRPGVEQRLARVLSASGRDALFVPDVAGGAGRARTDCPVLCSPACPIDDRPADAGPTRPAAASSSQH